MEAGHLRPISGGTCQSRPTAASTASGRLQVPSASSPPTTPTVCCHTTGSPARPLSSSAAPGTSPAARGASRQECTSGIGHCPVPPSPIAAPHYRTPCATSDTRSDPLEVTTTVQHVSSAADAPVRYFSVECEAQGSPAGACHAHPQTCQRSGSHPRPQQPGHSRAAQSLHGNTSLERLSKQQSTRSQPLSLGRNVNLQNTKICNHITQSIKQQSSIQHPHLLEVTSIKLHQGNLIITEEQTNGGCLHTFIENLNTVGRRQGSGGTTGAEFSNARLCVARNIFQQMLIAVEFLHMHGLWGLGLTPRSFFLNWTPSKCLILKLRLPMLSLVTFTAAVAAGTEVETKMREDDVRSVFLLALYVLLGPHWNKRPEVTQGPDKGFIGALPLWSVPSDEDIEGMPEAQRDFVRLACTVLLLPTGEVPPFSALRRGDFFLQDLPKGAELMNAQLLQKPRNAKREGAAAMVSQLVSNALRSLQREMGPYGVLPPSAPLRLRQLS